MKFIIYFLGDDLSVKIPVDVQDGVPEPKIRFYKGSRELKNDSRVTITDKPFGSILQIKKTRFPDEAKYTAVLEQGGTPVDQATFSVFIKGKKIKVTWYSCTFFINMFLNKEFLDLGSIHLVRFDYYFVH